MTQSIIYGVLFLGSILFVISYQYRNSNNNDVEKLKKDATDAVDSISKIVKTGVSKLAGSASSNQNNENSSTSPVKPSQHLPPSKPLPNVSFSPQQPQQPQNQQPQQHGISNLSPKRSAPPPPLPPRAHQNQEQEQQQKQTTPPPPPPRKNDTKPSIIEKGKTLKKILPKIPEVLSEEISKQKDNPDKKKGISTLRGIIGGVVKNIKDTAASIEEQSKNNLKRKNIAEEILQTEKVYVGKLKAIVEVYFIPLKTASTENPHPPLTLDQVLSIFSEILTIYNYNSHFLQNLDERMKSNSLILGDVFLSISDFLKSYSVYINNYSQALKTLEKVRKNPNVENLFQVFQTNPLCDGLDLNSLLIMPIQRVPRYILLLEQMVKNTDKSSPDFQNLNKALSKMKELASDMNENRREAELLNKMYTIQNSLEGFKEDFIIPARKLLIDGDFNERVLSAITSNNNRTKIKGKKLHVKQVLNVNTISFKELQGEGVLNIQCSSDTSSGDILILKSMEDNDEKWKDLIINQQKINKEHAISFEVKRDSLHL
eukprot:gene9995-12256_t